MSVLIDRARMTVSAAPGTGTIALGAAAPGQLTFAQAGVVDGQVLPYGIQDGDAWEVGNKGTYSASGPTLTRDAEFSSIGGGAITASAACQVYPTLIGPPVPTPAPDPVAAGLVGTGTTQTTALPLTAEVNIISGAPGATGFILASGVGTIAVQNEDPANIASIYPPVGAQINGLAVNQIYQIAVGAPRVSFSTNVPASQWWAG